LNYAARLPGTGRLSTGQTAVQIGDG
jgi:hypothetical protein